jgi:PAS domain S-box-containing protein
LSRRFIGMPAAEVEQGIDGALKAVIDAIGFDRSVMARLTDDRKGFIITHRYDGVASRALYDVGATLTVEALPALLSKIVEGKEVRIEDVSAVPDAGLGARSGIRAIAAFPLVVGGDVFGSVAFMCDRPSNLVHLGSLRTVAQTFASALDRKRIDEALRWRLRLTELTAAVSRRFIDVPIAELRPSIDDALRQIAELCGFKRAILSELSEDKKNFAITQRYLAPGFEEIVPLRVERPVASFGFIAARLAAKQPIVLSLDTLPPHAVAERREIELTGMTHVIMLPLVVGDELLGSVGLAAPALPEPSVLDMLNVVGELFTGALHRERAEKGLAERLRFEEALSRVAARLIDAQPDVFDTIVVTALRTVGESLDFDRVALFWLSPDRRFFNLVHEWCGPGIESFQRSMTGLPIDDFGWPLVEIRDGRAMVFGPAEVPPEGASARRVLERDGTRLLAFVPLVISGEVVGCIGFHRIRSAKRLAEPQLRRLRLVGDMIAEAMARRGAQVSLEHSEVRFAQVVAAALDGFAMIGETGIVLDWTAQTEKILGFPRGEVLGSPFTSIVAERDRESVAEMAAVYARAQLTASARIEISGLHRDGYEVPIELSISRLSAGESPAFGIFIRDITDRCRAEQVRQQAFDEISRLKRQIEGERDYLREEIRTERQFGDMIGDSPALRRVLDLVESVASTTATVLIRGESGVGKEVVARAIHSRSRRADGPLVKVNCASVPKELFESEFFGHVRGAFTGALRDRVGRFELADRGTLFLDEVGEIPIDLQAKLLRVLQESEFERVGADRTRKVDVRVVAATNRDLEAEAATGRFRKDLFYRLSVFPIEVPPLRQRREDVVLLARHFLQIQSRNLGRAGLVLEDRHEKMLLAYDWPGNVRELQHVIERAVILSREPPLRLDLSLPVPSATQVPPSGNQVLTDSAVRALERDNIVSALERCGWRISGADGAAELLGVSPSTLRDRMRSFDIQRPKAN